RCARRDPRPVRAAAERAALRPGPTTRLPHAAAGPERSGLALPGRHPRRGRRADAPAGNDPRLRLQVQVLLLPEELRPAVLPRPGADPRRPAARPGPGYPGSVPARPDAEPAPRLRR